MSRWYRAYEGTVTDAKLAEAAFIAEVSRSVSIAAWHCLLESAACKNNCGSYETSARRVAMILCEPVERIGALFDAFAEIGLTKKEAISAWAKRQHASDTSAERTRKWREKKQAENVTNEECDGDVTSPNTETETEVKKDSVPNGTVSAKVTIDQLQDAWNAVAVPAGAIECRKMGPERRRKADSFLKRYPIEDITEAIEAVAQSDFLCGRGKDGFRADIEFLFSAKHMGRLSEGFYVH